MAKRLTVNDEQLEIIESLLQAVVGIDPIEQSNTRRRIYEFDRDFFLSCLNLLGNVHYLQSYVTVSDYSKSRRDVDSYFYDEELYLKAYRSQHETADDYNLEGEKIDNDSWKSGGNFDTVKYIIPPVVVLFYTVPHRLRETTFWVVRAKGSGGGNARFRVVLR